jgi:hypothetical protein
MTETRIRWEPNGHSGFLGYAGTLTDSDWLFQVWRLDAVTGTWRLSSSLAGQFAWDLDHDGPDELKATAERWLEEFVSSLGAVFPEPESAANYDNLTPAQQARFDTLMTQPTNQWPPELIQHVRDTPGPFCGDALADTVAGWVRSQS